MAGLIYKEWLTARKYLSFYGALLAIYLLLVLTGAIDVSILSGVTLLFTIIPLPSSFDMDEKSRWDSFAAITPAGRRGVVDSKYLFALLTLAAGLALVLFLSGLCLLLGRGGMEPRAVLLSALACTGLAGAVDAILLPILLRFGAVKGRWVAMGVFLAVFGGGLILFQRGLLRPPVFSPGLAAVLALVAVGSFALSYFIALGIYEKKEF